LSNRNSSVIYRTGSMSNKSNRITRIISENNLTKSFNVKETNNGDSTFDSIYVLNNSSSPSLVKFPLPNSFNKTEAINMDTCKTLKQSITDDLDEYASNNQSSFCRRISIRKSRKSPFNSHNNEISTHRQSLNNGALNSSLLNGMSSSIQSQTNQSASESNFLFSFLNSGFEQNREISSNRNGIVIDICDSKEFSNEKSNSDKLIDNNGNFFQISWKKEKPFTSFHFEHYE
jgi:hypothetical protein